MNMPGRQEWPPEPQNRNEGREAELELTRLTFEDIDHNLKNLGASEFTDTTGMAKAMPAGELVVRREHPDAVMDLLNGTPLQVKPFSDGVRYANCAIWDTRTPAGLNNAFLEGYSEKNHVVAVLGFAQGPDMDVANLEESADTFAGMERKNVRSFTGALESDDIRFVLLRMPLEALKEEQMTEVEIERYDEMLERRLKGINEPAFAYRGYTFPKRFQ